MKDSNNIKKTSVGGIILLLSLAVGFLIGWYAYSYIKNRNNVIDVKKVEQQVGELYKKMDSDLYASIKDEDFVKFANTIIETRCPFYEPDGATYRACLSDWEEELANKVLIEQADEVHAYCSTFTKKYSDETSLEGTELFLKCSIYKLQI